MAPATRSYWCTGRGPTTWNGRSPSRASPSASASSSTTGAGTARASVPTQGSVHEDVADLAAIIERAGAPAHVLGNSMGASVSLRLAAARPELLRTLSVHEPPLFDILRDDPKTNPLAEELDARILPVINDLAAGNMGMVRAASSK